MTAPVSVVIPTLQAAHRVGPCLGRLTEGVVEGLIREVVIADGGSEDGIVRVADEVGARLVIAERGRGRQLATGARTASGQWLLFLHADTELSPGWGSAVRRHIAECPERAGYFRLKFDSPKTMARVTEAWANLRSRLFALPYGDQGLLISRAVYEAAGGFPEQALMEDVALVRRLGRARLAPLDAVALTSAERYEREGWMLRGARNILLVARYLAGADPDHLARRYNRRR
ncbi:MAG: TIGR04283 family arsenosugar biosynthesis glycosyltransferase [Pikeienuella sp.]